MARYLRRMIKCPDCGKKHLCTKVSRCKRCAFICKRKRLARDSKKYFSDPMKDDESLKLAWS